MFLTYVLGVAWLGVFGFSAVPVFMFYNIWSTCEVIKSPQTNGTAGVEQICVDIRQYGMVSLYSPDGLLSSSVVDRFHTLFWNSTYLQCWLFSGGKHHLGS